MIVVCEGCQKRFQLDDARIPAKGARVRCKYCHHRFRVPPPGEAQTEASSPSVEAGSEVAQAAAGSAGSATTGDDTLFGGGSTPPDGGGGATLDPGMTGGAPIEGDRSLFGSMAEEEDASGGLTQELKFVDAIPAEFASEGPADVAVCSPEPEPEPESEPEPAPDSRSDPEPESGSEIESEPDSEGPDASLVAASGASRVAASRASGSEETLAAAPAASGGSELDGSQAPEVQPAGDEDVPFDGEELPFDVEVEAPPSMDAGARSEGDRDLPPTDDEDAPRDDAGEAPPVLEADGPDPAGSEDSPEPRTEGVSAEGSDPDETMSESKSEPASEDSWEFAESELSFDEDLEPTPEIEAEGPEPEEARSEPDSEPADETPGEDTLEAMQLDPGSSHSGSGAAPVVDETPSMRAVGPGAGPDATTFEMVVGGEEDSPLELDDGSEGAAELPVDPAIQDEPAVESAPVEAPVEAVSDGPEIGTAADWDRLAGDLDEPGPQEATALDAVEPDPAAAPEANPVATGLDTSESSEDLLEFPLPPEARPGSPWLQHGLQHAGWALSLILLLSVAQGTVRIEPTTHEGPAGQVEVAGLTASDVRGRFVENANSGTLFVVSGELKNLGASPRLTTPLRVVLLDEHGFPFEGSGAPVGIRLTEALVRETPVGALQQRAQGLQGRKIGPGDGIRFQAILGEVPEAAVRFRVEAAPHAPEAAGQPIAQPEAS